MSLVLDEHRELLSDAPRLRAFEAALRETITPDHVVLDLASGTGILGLLACRAGARHVYSVDDGGILQVARDIARANHLADRITYIHGRSTRVTLPERVDVVVADQIGRFGFEAGIIDDFADARVRFLKPGGVMMPSAVDLFIAPVSVPDLATQIEFWNAPLVGFDMRPATSTAQNTGYPVRLDRAHVLGEACRLTRIDLSAARVERAGGDVVLTVDRPGSLHGIGGWFGAPLSQHVELTNSPLSAERIRRRNIVLPIACPVAVDAGDRVHVTISMVPAELLVSWQVEVTTPAGSSKGTFSHTTFRGMLITREDLEKTRPQFTPTLTPWGAARRSVLELVDGVRTLAAIEEEMHRRHRDILPSEGEVAKFVAEVLGPYAH